MASYRVEDTIVRTENATQSWEEQTRWDGHNHISVNTGSQWEHQKLYRSRRGRYYIECWSQWQGTTPHAEWLSPEEAARWLLRNNETLPTDLAEYEETVSE